MGDICISGRHVGASLWVPVEAEAHMHGGNHTVGKCAVLDPVFIVPDTDTLQKGLPSHRSHQKGTLKGGCSLCSTQE